MIVVVETMFPGAVNRCEDMTDARRRVKVYDITADKSWTDRGTGYASLDHLESRYLLVRSETNDSLILESEIQAATAYNKQKETMIVWTERKNVDIALSFEEKVDCDEVWKTICHVLGSDPALNSTQGEAEVAVTLPPCEFDCLQQINKLLSIKLNNPSWRKKMGSVIKKNNYIIKLLNLFHVCEELDNISGLHCLHSIFRSLLLLNKTALFEVMFQQENILNVVGCLEYDPSSPGPVKHRQYLKELARFKEIVPINNPEIVATIHQTYRVQYIQDIVLPMLAVVETNVLTSLSRFISCNKAEIVTKLLREETFMTELFTLLTDEATDALKRRDLMLFLQEFYGFSYHLHASEKYCFHTNLRSRGIFQVLERTLSDVDHQTKLASMYILSSIVDHSPCIVREFILQHRDRILMNVMIQQAISNEVGPPESLMAILRVLLNPANMGIPVFRSDFLKYFYRHSVDVLIAPVLVNTEAAHLASDDGQTGQTVALILELLAFCVQHHSYHMKFYFQKKDLLRRILVFLKSKHTFLVLHVVRFMRRIIALKDEFYNRYIIRANLLEPVIDVFVRNNGRYNLLDSAIVEMFEFIKCQGIKSLCLHIMERHGQLLHGIDYVKTFKELQLKYEGRGEDVEEWPEPRLLYGKLHSKIYGDILIPVDSDGACVII